MTIGKIKIEALKLMYLGARDLHEEDLDELGADQNYSDYLAAMPGCINRALQDMVVRSLLPVKVAVLSGKNDPGWVYGGAFFDLSTIVPDLYEVERIARVNPWRNRYQGAVSYAMEGDGLIIPDYQTGGGDEYRLLYRPTLSEVSGETRNDYELPIPDALACAIPYFIKAELYASDTPSNLSEAQLARQSYEAALSRYATRSQGGHQTRIKNVFGRW